MSDNIKRLNGVYRATVKNNRDPQNLRRLQLQVQTTGVEVTDWVWPVISSKRPPEIGSGVFVFYIGGDPEYPVWIGEFGKADTATGFQGLFSYGAWQDRQTQTASINTPTALKMRVKDYEEGVYVKQDTKIYVENTAQYNIQFSLQLHNAGGGGNGNYFSVWFRKNGQDIPWSATRYTIPTNNPYQAPALNYFVDLKNTDYLEIMWAVDNSSIRIEALPAASGIRPEVPSVIVTMNQIA